MEKKLRFWNAKLYFENKENQWQELWQTRDIEIETEKNSQNIIANSSLFQTRQSIKSIKIRWKLYNLSLEAISAIESKEIEENNWIKKISFSGYQEKISRWKFKIENTDENQKAFWIIINSWYNKIWLNSLFLDEKENDDAVFTNIEILWVPDENAGVFEIYEQN